MCLAGELRMRDEHRWLLALGLSMAILFGWQALMAPQAPVAPAGVPAADQDSAGASGASSPAARQAAAAQGTAASLPTNVTAPSPAATTASRRFAAIAVTSPEMALTVSGNVVVAWTQVGYRADLNNGDAWLDICAGQPAPCLEFGFVDRGAPDHVEALGDPVDGVRALWRTERGALTAELRLAPDHRALLAFGSEGDVAGVRFQPYVRLAYRPPLERTSYVFAGLRVHRGGELESLKLDDLEPSHQWQGRFDWLMWDRKYFGRAVFPPAQDITVHVERRGEDETATASLLLTPAARTLGPEPLPALEFMVFGGPKDLSLLKRVGGGLFEAIDYGWTGFVARPMLALLHVFHALVGNYGWAIVLLTVVIKFALYPLTKKSYRSMAAMSKLRPKMEELQQKFKKDPQRLNQEMLNLYRSEKVNPLGGCLPMLVQIPIFFALYNVLLISIELRHAPWGLWVVDLSAPDTLTTLHLFGLDLAIRVLPLVMGATMLLQQKLMPAQVDPMQQKIFMLMPIMFTFISYAFPSGLVLYWITNNVVSIAQQWWIQRQMREASV